MFVGNGTTKRIVFITTRLFWPADSGRKVSLYHYCKGMHEQLGYDVYLYTFLEGEQIAADADAHPDFITEVRVAEPVSAVTQLKNLVSILPRPGMPFQCALYWSKGNRDAFRAYCEEVGPDVVIVDMVRLAPYMDVLEDLGFPIVLDYDDLLSKRYERQVGKGAGSMFGNYGAQVSGLTSRLVSSRIVKDAVLSMESGRMRLAEDAYARRSDAVLFVSPLEAAELDDRLGTRKCFDATLGAEAPDLPESMPDVSYSLGFVGNMRYAANQASLDYICNEVLPLLPGKTLRVIGVCPDDLPARYEHFGQVSFSGRVETIAEELLKCEIMLAPFAYGSGIKTKVLEAMGMGMPVVTNSLGVEGMTCKSGAEVELGETAQELADACKGLLNDPEKRRAVGLAGQEYVRRCHDWHTSIENLGRCLNFAITVGTGR